MLNIDLSSINGPCQKKRILYLKCFFLLLTNTCLHIGYKSQRGLGEHIDSTHTWYYYFKEQPTVTRAEAIEKLPHRVKCTTHNMPAFSIADGIGHQFLKWLSTLCGGGKSNKEAVQIGRRTIKLLKASMGEQQEESVSEGYAEYCLG